jgi:beta-1,4-mannosyltransferase
MKILVYPKGENPYQELLYQPLRRRGIEIEYFYSEFIDNKHGFVLGIPTFPVRLLIYRLKGFNVLHLHWLTPFVIPVNNSIARFLSSVYVISFILWTKLLGFKLVWTMHEILPHEKEFHNDIYIRKLVSNFSNSLILHSQHSKQDAIDLGFNLQNSCVIPIGSYTEPYLNDTTKEEARGKLGISDAEFVFVFFGLIKQYKGIENLLVSFEKLMHTNSTHNIHLVIAGKCLDDGVLNIMQNYAMRYPTRIHLYNKHIPDEEVQLYFNASDIAVFPYEKNTTSSSILLAFSFGKPIIAPLLGSINDIPRGLGFFYDSNDKMGLIKSMIKAITGKNNLSKIGIKGRNYINNLSWNDISTKHLEIYKKIT